MISKIIKIEKNNHYGYATTKPFPIGCFKKQKEIPLVKESNQMIKNIIFEDKTSHIIVVNIKFDEACANTKTLMYNEVSI